MRFYWSARSIPELQRVAAEYRGRVARLEIVDAVACLRSLFVLGGGGLLILFVAHGVLPWPWELSKEPLRAAGLAFAFSLLLLVWHQLVLRWARRSLRDRVRSGSRSGRDDGPASREPWGIWWAMGLVRPPTERDVSLFETSNTRVWRSWEFYYSSLLPSVLLGGISFFALRPPGPSALSPTAMPWHLVALVAAALLALPVGLLTWRMRMDVESITFANEEARRLLAERGDAE